MSNTQAVETIKIRHQRRVNLARDYIQSCTERPKVKHLSKTFKLEPSAVSALVYERFGPTVTGQIRNYLRTQTERPYPLAISHKFGVSYRYADELITQCFGPKAVTK